MALATYSRLILVFQLGIVPLRVIGQIAPIKSSYFHGISASLRVSNNQREFLPSAGDTDKPLVKIRDGALRGFTLRTINWRAISAFQSIPFAAPPVGPQRFQAPQKNRPWKGTLNALPQSPQCLQLDFLRGYEVHGQEDCLYLNVYTPREHLHSQRKLPVMVWIHGGAFFFGAGSLYGPRYLLDKDVVLVTINYRLGPFGFFSTGDAASSGNQGMKDQVLALQWVRDNIAQFGGNVDAVTIFGQSAGGGSVGLHLISPLSRGLFHRAITESGTAFRSWANPQNISTTAKHLGEIFHCPRGSTKLLVSCLQEVPGHALASVQLTFMQWSIFPFTLFEPEIEVDLPGAFMTKPPAQYYEDGEAANVTLLTGLVQNEMSWLVSAMIQDPRFVEGVNRNWERVGPIMLGLEGSTPEENADNARKIWRFYMGSKKLTWNSRMNFAQLFGGRTFNQGALEAMRYHSMYTGRPVYAYRFSYQGRYSSVQHFGAKPEDWGVAHMADLIYLLNNPDYYGSLHSNSSNASDNQMSGMMTRMWANFATSGNPNDASYGTGRKMLWQPIEPATDTFSPVCLLDLNLRPKMIADPYEQEYLFWMQEINSVN